MTRAASGEGRVAMGVAMMIVLLVGLALINPLPIGVVHDDAMYVILGKSLATGQGLRWLNLPGTPNAIHYPPGFPALLSLVWRVLPEFPANVWAFKALNALLLAAAAGALVLFAQKRLGWSARVAAAVAIIGCLSIPMLVLSTTVMSETFCFALLVPALLFADRVLDAETTSVARAAALGAVAAGLVLVRTNMIAFAAAVIVALLIKRRWRAAAICAATAFVVVLPWELWVRANTGLVPQAMRGDYESYGNWLVGGAGRDTVGFAFRTIGQTAREMFGMLAGLTTAGLPTYALRLIAVLSAIAFVIAGIVYLWSRAHTAALFMLAYLGMILLWPFSPTRFLWGIWPLVFVIGAAGVSLIAHRSSLIAPRSPRIAALGLAALVAVGYTVYNVRGYRGRWWSSLGRQTASVSVPSVAWIGEHARPGDVVVSNAELMVYLYTGRQAVPATRLSVEDFFQLPSVRSRTEVLESILQVYHPDLVAIVANDSLEAAARRMASRQPPALALRDSVPHGLILSSMVR